MAMRRDCSVNLPHSLVPLRAERLAISIQVPSRRAEAGAALAQGGGGGVRRNAEFSGPPAPLVEGADLP